MADGDQRSDQELIDAAADGDMSAVEVLYRRHRDWVVRVAFRFTRNQEDAIDVLQDTFVYLWKKLPHLHLAALMTSFLYPVVKHCALAAVRKRARANPPGDLTSEVAIEPSPSSSLVRSELAVAMGSIPEQQRETLLMRYVDDMPMKEIAASLKVPLGTVKSRIHNALRTLRDDERTRHYFDV